MDRDKVASERFENLAKGITTPCTSKGGASSHTESLKDKFIRLERLKKTENSRWWDSITLQQYLKLNRVPRGLRSQLFPTFEDLDDDILSKWEDTLTNNSKTLIQILIEIAERKVASLQIKISELEKEIQDLNLKEATEKNYEILKGVLTRHQNEIKDRKRRQLKRDEADYKEGRVYYRQKIRQISTEHNTEQEQYQGGQFLNFLQ